MPPLSSLILTLNRLHCNTALDLNDLCSPVYFISSWTPTSHPPNTSLHAAVVCSRKQRHTVRTGPSVGSTSRTHGTPHTLERPSCAVSYISTHTGRTCPGSLKRGTIAKRQETTASEWLDTVAWHAEGWETQHRERHRHSETFPWCCAARRIPYIKLHLTKPGAHVLGRIYNRHHNISLTTGNSYRRNIPEFFSFSSSQPLISSCFRS